MFVEKNHCMVFFFFASQKTSRPFFLEVFSKSFLFPEKKKKNFHRQFCRKLITVLPAELIAYVVSIFSLLQWLQRTDFLTSLMPYQWLCCRKGFAEAHSQLWGIKPWAIRPRYFPAQVTAPHLAASAKLSRAQCTWSCLLKVPKLHWCAILTAQHIVPTVVLNSVVSTIGCQLKGRSQKLNRFLRGIYLAQNYCFINALNFAYLCMPNACNLLLWTVRK